MERTPVILRRWNAEPRSVIALFPTVPGDYAGQFCQSYEHIGQHGSADFNLVVAASAPANMYDPDCAALLGELNYDSLDDNLIVKCRSSYAMHAERRETARNYR